MKKERFPYRSAEMCGFLRILGRNDHLPIVHSLSRFSVFLSLQQKIKNKSATNIPPLGIYVDYQKAYDRMWQMELIIKLHRMQIPLHLLKAIANWLDNRKAYIIFGKKRSDIFTTHIGLPQGTSLTPYIFIIYHAGIVNCIEAFPTQMISAS